MTPRLRRALRALEQAQRCELEAKSEVLQANKAVADCTAKIGRAHQSGARLSAMNLPLTLKSRYSQIGARNLHALNQERSQLRETATVQLRRWEATKVRVKSFEKLVERIKAAERAQRQQQEAAEMLDTVGARSAGQNRDLAMTSGRES